jgi:membrane protease YdiL (CAAX protease family)
VIVAIAVAGALAVVVAWRLTVARRVSVWWSMGVVEGAAGIAAIATGRVRLARGLAPVAALAIGVGAGLALYLATRAFVAVARRWPVFERHVATIYDRREGLPLWTTLVLAAGVTAAGEELFWRGLVQGRFGVLATWGAYIVANVASESLPIVAGAIVSGAVWGGLALGTHGVLASLGCHAVWTALMLALPPA